MKFKFAIIGITALLLIMFVKQTMEHGFNVLNLIGIIVVAVFLFWIDHKLERPVTKESLKQNIKRTRHK
ncbi:hypothetical protein [Macrococcus sp. DPC7161]|uniref:hypothetical protein n=1 Tax=Macrococcus sp. DPC7161 TaxID=2507060 RepID=UPI00100A92E0|nr:hypothetical protein [Macrococcus sp. DPC7161]RXK17776.1 hypothetical protein ER639_08275 [Macrococcus sp. DPC7161]